MCDRVGYCKKLWTMPYTCLTIQFILYFLNYANIIRIQNLFENEEKPIQLYVNMTIEVDKESFDFFQNFKKTLLFFSK